MITTDGRCDLCGQDVPVGSIHYCYGTSTVDGGSTTWPTGNEKEAVELADYRASKDAATLNARLATLEAQVAAYVSEAASLREAVQCFPAELERLAALVREGFYEGWNSRLASGRSQLSSWNLSATRHKLEGGHVDKTLAAVFAAEAARQADQTREGE